MYNNQEKYYLVIEGKKSQHFYRVIYLYTGSIFLDTSFLLVIWFGSQACASLSCVLPAEVRIPGRRQNCSLCSFCSRKQRYSTVLPELWSKIAHIYPYHLFLNREQRTAVKNDANWHCSTDWHKHLFYPIVRESGFRNPRKFLLVESEIRGNSACGIIIIIIIIIIHLYGAFSTRFKGAVYKN